jgi:hypothetical protein
MASQAVILAVMAISDALKVITATPPKTRSTSCLSVLTVTILKIKIVGPPAEALGIF